MVNINENAPEFTEDAFVDDEIKKISLSDYKGKWTVLFFYPADFTFVCPTELGSLADNYEKFKSLNAEVISVSTDTAFVHKAWHDHSETIKKIRFPMLADPARRVCKAYWTLIEDEGLSLRATYIIDLEGKIKAFEFHDNSIGRSVEELLRKLEAAQFVAKHKGQVCPMNWKPGSNTLKPGLDLVGKI
ncbi:MAG: redoxin domain-containing protein [Nanoarchaeota archaeon]|nr:redoxin domain-containing protein [Nanoarchaeota archaeon]MBU1704144.1 redoxin domain-containing protein [Nanoarchaeota archaeon]